MFVEGAQQFRVEIRDTADNVLLTAYLTISGDATIQGWTNRSADLTSFAGQTIRIAFVEIDSYDYFNLHLDNITITGATSAPTIPVIVNPGEVVLDVNFGTRLLLPGDYNLNGIVDAADYTVWADSRGSLRPSFLDADGSGNGIIDAADHQIWSTNFGQALPAGGAGGNSGH